MAAATISAAPAVDSFTSTASGLLAIHAVDLDGDAQLDVVVVHAAGVDVHMGQGTGVFAVPSTVMFRDPVQGRRTVLLADVVADGKRIYVASGDRRLWCYQFNKTRM